MNNLLTSTGYRVQTMEDLKLQVPAAFSNIAHPERTEKYSFFSTEDFLKVLMEQGWNPYSAKQHGANPYSRHIIRLENPKLGKLNINGDSITPQLMLDNSHDGYTPGQIHAGLFRQICSNGLVVGMPNLHTSVKFRHIGLDPKQIMETIELAADQYTIIGSHIEDMQNIKLSEDEKIQLAMQALALREPTRFVNEDGTLNTKEMTASMDPRLLFAPARPEDAGDDLWRTFNTIQERTVNGLYERLSPTGKKSSPRVITNAARNLVYNRQLWTAAEAFMPSLM